MNWILGQLMEYNETWKKKALSRCSMTVVVQIEEKDSAKAWAILVRHSAGTALPNRTFIVSDEAVRALRAERVHFTEISRNGVPAPVRGAISGERI